mgnify:CR=1 FL=1
MSDSQAVWLSLRENPWVYSFAVAFSALQILINMTPWISGFWPNAIHVAGFVLLAAIWYPASVKLANHRGVNVASFIFALLVSAAIVWLFANEDAIYDRGVHLSQWDWVAGILVIFGALEFTRRTAGLWIPALIVIALAYVAWWGSLIPGVFKFSGLSLETILFRSIFGDDGMFGNITTISSTFVVMFIIFGAFLVRSGAGDFIIRLAQIVAGRFKGGPGLVAVFASGLTGTISGSAVANTASTGVITIPLMIRSGFPPKFAAGVEAVASTGGQLMPPIMGAGAFIMANYTQIPYSTIVLVSFLPAVLYFFSVAAFVRIQANKFDVNLDDLVSNQANQPKYTARQLIMEEGLSFIIPIVVLISLLIIGFSPTYSAGIAILAIVVASWFSKNKMSFWAIADALALGSKNMVLTAVLLASIGLIVNVVATTGIGNTFSLMIVQWSQGYLWLAILLVAIASLILGMGLPVTAAYIMIATISAPALQQLMMEQEFLTLLTTGALAAESLVMINLLVPDAGLIAGQAISLDQAQLLLASLPPDFKATLLDQSLAAEILTATLLSAHMIIFWLSQDSNVTPPVCLTAFTAAAIAKSPPMATGVTAWKLAKALYILPLLFAYTPILTGAYHGEWLGVLQVAVFAGLGLYALSAVMLGWLELHLSWAFRGVLIVASALMIVPLGWPVQLCGLVLFVLVFVLHKRQGATEPLATVPKT